ncbi:jg16043 [Pararge aegeria aegeria]|uniref:Jg16043 protein n=1 Tax=Pararge aegeria aegeria TaxID=348720 RepID=A0A8S4SHM8_9NEOP|nr:jg16043 [Pararge aegeria aegeria]
MNPQSVISCECDENRYDEKNQMHNGHFRADVPSGPNAVIDLGWEKSKCTTHLVYHFTIRIEDRQISEILAGCLVMDYKKNNFNSKFLNKCIPPSERACMEADETPTHVMLRCRGVARESNAQHTSATQYHLATWAACLASGVSLAGWSGVE